MDEGGYFGHRRVAFAGDFVAAVGGGMQLLGADDGVGRGGMNGKDADCNGSQGGEKGSFR